MTENEIGKLVVDSAVTVHRELGPGLLETVYEVILAHELQQRGLRAERQVPISIESRGIKFDEAFGQISSLKGRSFLNSSRLSKLPGRTKSSSRRTCVLQDASLDFCSILGRP